MRFAKFIPTDKLKPFIHYFAIAENTDARNYKVLPSPGLVIGFQYKGQLSFVKDNKENTLATSGITGLQDTFRVFKNISNTGTVLVYFTETDIAHFSTCPANEFFNQVFRWIIYSIKPWLHKPKGNWQMQQQICNAFALLNNFFYRSGKKDRMIN